MITIGNFKDINDSYDEVWMIVRSLKTNRIPQVNTPCYHIPALSPSKELFDCYLSWRTAGIWNHDTFERYYKPRFIHEMQSAEAQGYLQLLRERSVDKNILLTCFCDDESMCHRSLVYQLVMNQPFYLLVAGSRNYNNYTEMREKLDYVLMNKTNVIIVSGGAGGADTLAEQYAQERGYECKVFKAEWSNIEGLPPSAIGYRRDGTPYRKRAGFERNITMHEFISTFPERGCICFWDGQSKGTAHNFDLASQFNTQLKVYNYTTGMWTKIEART